MTKINNEKLDLLELEKLKIPIFIYLSILGVNLQPDYYQFVSPKLARFITKSKGYPNPLDVEFQAPKNNSIYNRKSMLDVEQSRSVLLPNMFNKISPKAVNILKKVLAKQLNKYIIKRNQFVEKNFKLVHKFIGKRPDREDLFQDGVCGLMLAVDRYCYSKGFRFGTYAVWWIKRFIDTSNQNNKPVAIPVHHQELMVKIQKIKSSTVEDVDNSKMASILGVKESKVKQAIEAHGEVESLNKTVGFDMELGDVLLDESTKDPLESEHEAEVRRTVFKILSEMDELSRHIICLRLGLNYE